MSLRTAAATPLFLSHARMQVYGGNAFVRGCEFQAGGKGKSQLLLAEGAGKVIVTDNIVDGPLIMNNAGAAAAIVKDNLGDSWQ